jgi:predicted component of type VI protein secretion system
MSSERLLKRLRHWGKGEGERVSRLDAGEYRKSVLADIALLYNTQRGTVLIAGDMGVPDFTSLLNRFGPQEVASKR